MITNPLVAGSSPARSSWLERQGLSATRARCWDAESVTARRSRTASDGLVKRTVTPTVPPQVSYSHTPLGADLAVQLWGLVSSSPILGKDGVLVGNVGMVTDITERKRAEDQLRCSADRLAMLHDMDQAIVAAQSPTEIGRAALGRMRRMVPCQRCTVVLFDFKRREAQLIAGFSQGAHLTAEVSPLSDHLPGESLRTESVRYIEDLSAQEDPPPFYRQLLAEPGECQKRRAFWLDPMVRLAIRAYWARSRRAASQSNTA